MISKLKNFYWKLITWIRMLKNWHFPAWFEYAKVQYSILFNTQRCTKASERSLLVLAWEFAPDVRGSVYRPISWTKYAASANWKVNVLCSEVPSITSAAGIYLESSIPLEVGIHRVADRSKGPHPWLLPRVDGELRNALAVFKTAQALMKTNQPGVLLASGPPFHNFLVATWLAKQYDWPLVLDYRDEWTESPFTRGFVLKDQANSRLEKYCLRQADLVIFTTESQRMHAIQTFPKLDQAKCIVVTNGWDPSDFAIAQSTPISGLTRDAESTITIAYLGNLGPMADPQPFLDTLSKILDSSPRLREQIKFQCIGLKSPDSMAKLSVFKYQENLQLIEHLPKQYGCQVMQSVDFLLILNPPTIHRYIQGKLYEYIASGTPVLVFGRGGEMADIVSSLDAGIIVDDKVENELAHVLNNFNSQIRPRNSAKIDQWLKSRQRNVLALSMFEHLDKLIKSYKN